LTRPIAARHTASGGLYNDEPDVSWPSQLMQRQQRKRRAHRTAQRALVRDRVRVEILKCAVRAFLTFSSHKRVPSARAVSPRWGPSFSLYPALYTGSFLLACADNSPLG
jgi:hypothetical protein